MILDLSVAYPGDRLKGMERTAVPLPQRARARVESRRLEIMTLGGESGRPAGPVTAVREDLECRLQRWRGSAWPIVCAIGQTFPGTGSSTAREYSEATAQAIEVEIAGILSAAHARVRTTLTGPRSAVEAPAKLLIDTQVVNAERRRALLGPSVAV